MLKFIFQNWKHEIIGFKEDTNISKYFRANPHMHLLEASLAWEEVKGTNTEKWKKIR